MGYGETYHRTVVELDRTLHQTLAERAAAYHGSAVLVLDGAGDDLGCRRRILVDEHAYLALLKASAATCVVLLTLLGASLGIHYEVALLQELLNDAHSRLQVAAAVVLKVEDKVAHACFLQRVDRGHELAVCGCTERTDANVAHVRTYHVVGVERVYGYLGARHGERE